jgi:hypothetical protein
MITDKQLSCAYDISQKAYLLLKWLEEAMNKKFFSPKSAHLNMSSSQAVEEWLIDHIENLPTHTRPNIISQDELKMFCNYFSSFLTTSFDIVEKPGKRLYSEDAHCFCPMCSWLINVSHLKAKKIHLNDKKKSDKLKKNTLTQLCIDLGIEYPVDDFKEIINSNKTYESVSVITYGNELISRTKGNSNGASVLWLWRNFAWNKLGSPRKNFKFTKNYLLDSKTKVCMALKKMSA